MPFELVESSWLNLIEAQILAGQPNDAVSSANKAITTSFAQVQDSRLLALYLRFIAVAVNSPDVDALKSNEAYERLKSELQDFRTDSTGGLSLNWDNKAIRTYYTRTIRNSVVTNFVDLVTNSIFAQ